MRARLLIVFAAIVGALAFAAPQAHACSCAGWDMDRMFRWSDGAAVARLVAVDDINDQRATYTYEVVRAYKARAKLKPGDELAIDAPSYGAACGPPRRTSRDYGLFLTRSGGQWHVTLCSVVQAWRMRNAGEDRINGRSPRGPAGCAAG